MKENKIIKTTKLKSFRNIFLERVASVQSEQSLILVHSNETSKYNVLDLSNRVNAYCAFYEKHGIKENDTILIILKESLDLFACFFAGIIYGALPAYFAYPSPKQSKEAFLTSIDNLVEHNKIALIITFPEVKEILSGNTGIKNEHYIGCFNYNEVSSTKIFSIESFATPKREAFLQFSSGTTGAKKGVKISVEALFNQIESYDDFIEYDEKSVVVSWLPHYHDMGLIACMLMPFVKGITIVMMSPFDWVKNPKLLLETIMKYKGTHLWEPNFALAHLSKSIPDNEISKYNLSTLRQMVLCSEPVLRETVETFTRKFSGTGFKSGCLSNCYAMAENTFAITSSIEKGIKFLEIDRLVFQKEGRVIEQAGGRSVASAGVPLSNLQVRIIDENKNILGEGFIGEVLIKSNCMLDEYYNNPEATLDAFYEGYFRTGDLGFMYKGELYVTGRKKDLIIVGGENIYPQDIELILNEETDLIPGRNLVFGVEDERVGTEKIVILGETEKDVKTVDVTPLRKKIIDMLNIAVSDIVLLPHMSLKKGTAGKISRFLNKQEYLDGKFVSFSGGNKNDKLLNILSSVIPASMQVTLGKNTPLLSSGAIDSFGFIDLILALEKAYSIKIPVTVYKPEYFETPAIIEKTIEIIKSGKTLDTDNEKTEKLKQVRSESLKRLKNRITVTWGKEPFLIKLINHNPIKSSKIYRILFRLAGIHIGKKVTFLGKVSLKIRGKTSNIIIGDNVILGKDVDLRNRENGKIILHDRVYLDHNVRLVAARDGKIEIGMGTEIGLFTNITSGGITEIGEFAMISGFVNINSSRHGTDKRGFIKEQPHTHGKILIGSDVWIGVGANILVNTNIWEGAVVAGNSLVSGDVEPFTFVAGVPARFIKYRER